MDATRQGPFVVHVAAPESIIHVCRDSHCLAGARSVDRSAGAFATSAESATDHSSAGVKCGIALKEVRERMRPANLSKWQSQSGATFTSDLKSCSTCERSLCATPANLQCDDTKQEEQGGSQQERAHSTANCTTHNRRHTKRHRKTQPTSSH
jgi:hypothetical protein